MHKKIAIFVAAVAALLLLAVGLMRLQFSADIFGLLPKQLPAINALATYQKGFKREQELLLSVSASSARKAARAARDLASQLSQRQLASQVIWQDPAEQDIEVLAELLALQWLNVAPERMQALTAQFEEQQAQSILQQALADSFDAIDPFEAAIGLSDPFGLAKLSAEDSLESGASLVASADGRFRVLYLTAPPATEDLAAWVMAIKDWLPQWQQEFPELEVALAGTPAFNQEFATSLSSDMQKAVLGTLVLVALLFLWAHRRIRPLLWLLCLLALVLATTAAIGGQLLGTLNIISLGYAAVLMGLAADYGLLLYQAHRSSRQSAKQTVRQVAPSILWAALTTATAFLLVARGSLPGMAQLGLLVALGIAVAAVIMLALYLLPLRSNHSVVDRPVRLLPAKAALGTTALLLVVSVLLLLWRLPALNTDPDSLGPRQLLANEQQQKIDFALEREDDGLFVLYAAANHSQGAAAVQSAIDASQALLQQAKNDGLVSSYALPKWWPNASFQSVNRALMMDLSARWPLLLEQAESAGYPVDSMVMSSAVMQQFGLLASGGNIGLPQQPGSAWLFGQTAAINTAADEPLPGYFAVAQVALNVGVSSQQRDQLAAEINALPNAQMAGWPFASAGLLTAMKADFVAVALPMLGLLLLILCLAFRGLKEIILSLSALLLTLLCLSACMVLFGWQWNLMNLLALPLLVGVTVDYSIHTQLALQRFEGDLLKVYQHVGRAIGLAGATTAIGFGSLMFANNEGLSSLGQVAGLGVVLACVISVLLQPHWWRLWQRKRPSISPAENLEKNKNAAA